MTIATIHELEHIRLAVDAKVALLRQEAKEVETANEAAFDSHEFAISAAEKRLVDVEARFEALETCVADAIHKSQLADRLLQNALYNMDNAVTKKLSNLQLDIHSIPPTYTWRVCNWTACRIHALARVIGKLA